MADVPSDPRPDDPVAGRATPPEPGVARVPAEPVVAPAVVLSETTEVVADGERGTNPLVMLAAGLLVGVLLGFLIGYLIGHGQSPATTTTTAALQALFAVMNHV